MNQAEDPKAWKEIRFHKRLMNGLSGIRLFLKDSRHLRALLVFCVIIISFAFYYNFSISEWIDLILAMGFVAVSEVFNTAIEIDINLTSPDFHPYARDTKDMAAGAVLVSGMTCIVVILFLFIPRMM